MNHIEKVKEYKKLCEDKRWGEANYLISREMDYVASTGLVKLRSNYQEISDISNGYMDFPHDIKPDKIYKVYNVSSSSFYIKEDDGYNYYGITKIYDNSAFFLEPVDSALVSAITEYEALIEQAKQLLVNSGIEMLSPDVEKQIDWDSSSLDC